MLPAWGAAWDSVTRGAPRWRVGAPTGAWDAGDAAMRSGCRSFGLAASRQPGMRWERTSVDLDIPGKRPKPRSLPKTKVVGGRLGILGCGAAWATHSNLLQIPPPPIERTPVLTTCTAPPHAPPTPPSEVGGFQGPPRTIPKPHSPNSQGGMSLPGTGKGGPEKGWREAGGLLGGSGFFWGVWGGVSHL